MSPDDACGTRGYAGRDEDAEGVFERGDAMRPAHGTAVALLLSLAIWSAASLAIPGVRRPVLHALQSLSIHRTQVQAQLTPYP